MHRKASQAVHGTEHEGVRSTLHSAEIYEFKPNGVDGNRLSEIHRLEDENRRLKEVEVRTRIELARLHRFCQRRTG